MYIEHIAMYVNELEKVKDFLSSILMLHRIVVIIIKKQIFVPIF